MVVKFLGKPNLRDSKLTTNRKIVKLITA